MLATLFQSIRFNITSSASAHAIPAKLITMSDNSLLLSHKLLFDYRSALTEKFLTLPDQISQSGKMDSHIITVLLIYCNLKWPSSY